MKQILPTSSPPVINGNLDDKCWKESTMVSGFISVGGEWCREQTTAYVSYDSENLYIAFLCNESQPDKIKAEKKEHDDVSIYSDDCVEIFIDVNHDHQTYYHFMVNSLGATYEARCEIGRVRDIRDDTWNPNYRVATSIGEKYWVVETSIPFNLLGATVPEPETVWGINLNRERWVSTEGEFSSWARIDNFNDPTRFGLVRTGVGLPWVTNEGNDVFFLLPEEEKMLQKIREIVSVQKSDPLLFEKANIPVVFFGMVSMPVVSNLSKELLKGKCQETAVVSAAMRILGKEDLLDISVESKDQKIKKRPEDNILQIIYEKGGIVGHYYSHESQHVAFRKELNTKAGLAIIEDIVKEIAGTAGNIEKYIKILQENRLRR